MRVKDNRILAKTKPKAAMEKGLPKTSRDTSDHLQDHNLCMYPTKPGRLGGEAPGEQEVLLTPEPSPVSSFSTAYFDME